MDLFSGLGGFALAAAANDVETVVFCEANENCRQFLAKTWGLPVEPDVRKFCGRNYYRPWLLTAGTPCQPASRAGEQLGEADDRWLWPETIRACEECEPTWALFENPPGILDVGLDGILADMERLGYESQPISIPACAVDSPQDRERIWIINRHNSIAMGNRTEPGLQGGYTEILQRRDGRPTQSTQGDLLASSPRGRQPVRGSPSTGVSLRLSVLEPQGCILADSQIRKERAGLCAPQSAKEWWRRSGDSPWGDYECIPCPDGKGFYVIRRAPTGLYEMVDGVSSGLLEALGNSIVWPVAAEIIAAMIQAEA